MKSIQSILRLVTFLGMTGMMVACSAPQTVPQATAPSAPTLDIPALHTQVAQTVVAQITVKAALNPSPTAIVPTQPADPPTIVPTPTPLLILTETPLATIAVPVLETPTWKVQQTPSKTPYVDSCALESTSPEDGKVMSPGTPFEAYWVIKNTGKRPWTSEFYFQKVTGTLGYSGNIFVASTVDTGSEYTLHISMIAPNTTGNYNGTYKLINDDGTSICQFYVVIAVR